MLFSKVLNVFSRSCYPKMKHTFTNTNIKKLLSVCFGNKTFREPKVNFRGHGSTSRGRWLASRERGWLPGIRVGLRWVTGWPLVGHGWASDGSRVDLWWVTGWPLVGHGLASLWPPCKILYFGFIEFVRISTVRI